MKKGQVSTEYLVILAVVLVIALAVVYLVSQGSGTESTTLETQSHAYWRGVQPLALLDYSVSGTALTLELQNTGGGVVTLTQISGTDIPASAMNLRFAPGQTRVISATLSSSCGATGTQYIYENVSFTYNIGQITGKTFVGAKPLAGTCS